VAQTNCGPTLIVIPAFNEQGKIGRVVAGIPSAVGADILVVDDGSIDETNMEARSAGATVVRHERNMGVGAAIRSGIDYALTHEYEVVAIMSGDDQHDPSDLPRILRLIAEDGFDLVQGSRRFDHLEAPHIGLFRRSSTWFYARLFRALTGFPATDATNGGRAFRTAILGDSRINLWQSWLDGYELEPYLLYQTVRCGYRVTEAPMKVVYHDNGTTKMKPVRDWWHILRPLLFLAFRYRQ
jgi:dolichol-phosphate mannosyltransferase